jgi:predicted NBD/HSP70 family sugar kinase
VTVADIRFDDADLKGGFTASARSVFRRLVAEGPATRPQLCAALGLSRPTLSSSIAELDRVGFVEKIGEVQGTLGRKAAMYRLGAAAGHVIAVDAGSTRVIVRASTLDNRPLHHRVHRLSSSQRSLSPEISQVVAEEIEAARAAAGQSWGRLRAIGIAIPTRVVGPDGDQKATGQQILFTHFHPPADVPLLLENNVNCAAIGEQAHGAARGRADFAYVQIGVKIGLGIVLGDRLVRGRSGAAGEIGHLPYPWGPGVRPVTGELENYVGADAWIERVRAGWPKRDGGADLPPSDTVQLFELAEQGNAAALAAVGQHAEDIGAVVAACVGVIDPGLAVLGGGIGSHPLMLPHVRETVRRLSYPTEIQTSILGAEATVLGIEKIAAEYACDLFVGEVVG